MRLIIFSSVFMLLLTWGCGSGSHHETKDINYQIFESYHQIHVLKEGRLFASYLYDTTLLKPILFPVHSPSGILIERHYPFSVIEGESHDHPHHTGLFFTYGSEGEVNGNNFWANQQGLTKIRHASVKQMTADSNRATLETLSNWIDRDGKPILEEDRTMVFGGDEMTNTIDFTIRLKAIAGDVVFRDTKEGMFGIRVADWLSEEHGDGEYLNSEGDTMEAGVWGKRARWVRLEGTHDGKKMGIVIMNHPESVNFPTFWHARGYGLFAANPLGQSVFQEGTGVENPEPFNYTIKSGETGLFKFRVVIYEGELGVDQIEAAYSEYSI